MTTQSTDARLGLLKTTFIDYPGLVAATVFTAGCNLRCPYCHNPELVPGPPPHDFLPTKDILAFLERRRDVLGGVCLTGGEPLMHSWLPQFARDVHSLGLRVKLDTNGMFPDRIEQVAADYIAMDIKTTPDRYDRVGGQAGLAAARIAESIAAIRRTRAVYEFRTTVVEPLVTADDIRAITALLEPGERYTLTAFRGTRTLDPAFAQIPSPTTAFLHTCEAIATERGLDVHVRDHSYTAVGS